MNRSHLGEEHTTRRPANPFDSLRGPHYRGWSVLTGGFLCSMLAVGGSVYIFGHFVLPVSQAFDLSRADANNGLILKLVGAALWSPFIGRFLDRFSARLVMGTGALLYALGFVSIALSPSLWMIGLAILGPVSMGVSSVGSMKQPRCPCRLPPAATVAPSARAMSM